MSQEEEGGERREEEEDEEGGEEEEEEEDPGASEDPPSPTGPPPGTVSLDLIPLTLRDHAPPHNPPTTKARAREARSHTTVQKICENERRDSLEMRDPDERSGDR